MEKKWAEMNHAVDEHIKERMFYALFVHMAVWNEWNCYQPSDLE